MFSLFTRRTREPSTRLRFFANILEFQAFILGCTLIGVLIVALISNPRATLQFWRISPKIVAAAMATVSTFLVARALGRRQKWAGYLIAIALGAPLVKQALSPHVLVIPIAGIVTCTVGLLVIASVWNELGTSRDADFDDEIENEGASFARSPGYGASRRSLRQNTPDFTSANRIDTRKIMPANPAGLKKPAKSRDNRRTS